MNVKNHPVYTKLAGIYDAVMEDVDYELWADYIDAVILKHHPNPETLLELACGTGSLAISLDELECYKITGTDKSPQMIAEAHQKNKAKRCKVSFKVMNFLNVNLKEKFDVVFSVFDSINYLHTSEQILTFLRETKKVLKPDSRLIFDFTTPKNSIKAVDYLHGEEGYTEDNFRFLRKSTYDATKQIHTNEFQIEKLADDNETVLEEFQEIHHQKIYRLQQMLDIIDQSAYNIEAKYSDFDFEEANDNSLRITMVLRCPSIPS